MRQRRWQMCRGLSPSALMVVLLAVALMGPAAGQAQQRGARSPGSGSAKPAVAEREVGFRAPAFALTNARILTGDGQAIARGTVVLRGATIEAVGPAAEIPFDAEVIDAEGLTVTPGWIDGWSPRGLDPKLDRSRTGAGRPIDFAVSALADTPADNRRGMTPEFLALEGLNWDGGSVAPWRKIGFTAQLLAPDGQLVTGRSVLVSLSDGPRREVALTGPVALHMSFRTEGFEYPSTLMGAKAHIRQTLLDAEHHRRELARYEQAGRVGAPPPTDPALEALFPVLDGRLRVFIEADTFNDIHHALNFGSEFGLSVGIFGGAEAYLVADRLKAGDVPVIARIAFPEEPKLEADANAPDFAPARLRQDRHRRWKEQVANLAELHKAGVRFAISTDGHDGNDAPVKFLGHLRRAISAGLPPSAALAALTARPAQMFGADARLGRLTAGRAAHLAVFEGDPFAGSGPTAKLRMVFTDGVRFDYSPSDAPARSKPNRPATPKAESKAEPKAEPKAESKAEPKTEPKAEPKKPDPKKPEPDWAVELPSDRVPRLRTGGSVLIRNATLVTVSARGTIPNGAILIERGRITALGSTDEIKAPAGVPVIDAGGRYVVPGIIDTHSHMAISGGVNEATLSIVPEVRIKDAVNSSDPALYRALAGGVTTARLLHGSANCIGGQDAVIKLKYGAAPQAVILADAPLGVKFALGENVKRSRGRFPNSRMGVEATLMRAFAEARHYRAMWEKYGRDRAVGNDVAEPRRDLRLEALAAVLSGDIKVHCHCYRADEIQMLLRVADAFGVKVQSLQHALEAYKVAPEIAAHGCSVSTFSDWWAYKIEAADAVPHNVALLHEAGAVPVIKSDSHELVRHLYLEAAKMVKYGGTPEAVGLATVTLNAARQLGLDKRIGSLEVGKDGDVAIYTRHPFDTATRVEMTLIEGEVWFQQPLSPDAVRPTAEELLRVDLDPARLSACGVSSAEVTAAVRKYTATLGDIAAVQVKEPKAGAGETTVRIFPAGGRLPRGWDKLLTATVGKSGERTVALGEVARLVVEAVPPPPEPPLPPLSERAAPLVIGDRRAPIRIGRSAVQAYDLVGGTVHTLDGKVLPGGRVVIRDGKIIAVQAANAWRDIPEQDGAVIVDAAGLHIYPGLIDAGCVLGLIEYGSARETQDQSDAGLVQPDLVAATAVNPDSEMIPVTRVNGVTAVFTRPTGGLVSGQGSVINLAGWTPKDMTVQRSAGLFVALGEPPSGTNFGTLFPDGADGDANGRKRRLREVRELFERARLYGRVQSESANRKLPAPPSDLRMEALQDYAAGRLPVFVQADSRAEILDALTLAEEAKLRVVIVGGKESWKCVDRLAAAKVAVVLGPVLTLPFEYSDPFDSVYRCAAVLHKAGVKFAIQTGGSANVRNLPYEAATAVAYGLPPEAALASVTTTAAEILGVADRMGRVKPGLLGNLMITTGDPLQVTTDVVGLFIAGEPVELVSKQTRLVERYRRRTQQVREPGPQQ